jgi:hypothetical protein
LSCASLSISVKSQFFALYFHSIPRSINIALQTTMEFLNFCGWQRVEALPVFRSPYSLSCNHPCSHRFYQQKWATWSQPCWVTSFRSDGRGTLWKKQKSCHAESSRLLRLSVVITLLPLKSHRHEYEEGWVNAKLQGIYNNSSTKVNPFM